ncbi:MAG: ABC transporter ATP-binding protein [Anaerolineae bacterium]|nr:ABC transporter ATP-binding protein [Anaerolineae bacterium]
MNGQPDAEVIRTDMLTKKFGDQVAVRELTFDVPKGTIFGFIGPSGSGKTTTIRLLTGVYKPTEGSGIVLGDEIGHFSHATKRRIGYMPQHFVLYPDLSVWANLNFAASVYGVSWWRRKRLNALLDLVELGEHKHKRARRLSGGMKRRLALAAALAHDPELIFFDEPTAGIDPVLRQKFWEHFEGLRQRGQTLFITTQYVNEASYCDLVAVLMEGRLLVIDTPDGLRRRALGGEVVNLATVEYMPFPMLQELADLELVQRVKRLDDRFVQVIVAEAHRAMPSLDSNRTPTWVTESDRNANPIRHARTYICARIESGL